MNQRAIVIGWIFLTIGMIVGAVWAAQARGVDAGDPRVQAMSLQDPKIFVALVCWVVYSFELFARAAHRLGRTAGGVSVGARLRDRAAELRADQLFPDEESQLLRLRLQVDASAAGRNQSSTAPVELRERSISRRAASSDGARARSRRAARRAKRSSLSTCNRAELYVACDEVGGARADLVTLRQRVPRRRPADARAARLRRRRSRRRAASVPRRRRPRLARRRRAADSRPGEGRAHGRRPTRRRPGPVLNRLFHSSFAVGKRVRTETGLGSGAVSVSYAAVALARKIFGDLDGPQRRSSSAPARWAS